MSYTIKIDQFEGPLDLLLHLIEKAELSINDIDIALITDQYLDYLDKMMDFDLEVTSEFIVLAATLLLIKSNSLLPKTRLNNDIDDIDDKQMLIERLMEYKKYKRAAELLNEEHKFYSNIYTREVELNNTNLEKSEPTLIGLTLNDLFDAFKIVLKANNESYNEVKERTIYKKVFTVKQKMELILNILKEKGKIKFRDLFHDSFTKENKIMSFLALLELMKLNKINVKQVNVFDDIYIYNKGA